MTTPATRLITLIMLLQRQPNQKAAALADQLGVSIRTFHRYIGLLDEMGIPVYTERGPNGGFSLVRGYRLPPLVFTPEEAVAVYLGSSLVGQMWGEMYDEPARGAMAKLDNVLPDEQREEVNWARRTLVATGMHRVDLTALTPLLEGIRAGARRLHRIRIAYHSSNSEWTQRKVDPYALVHRNGFWYLVGYCHLRGAMRTFRVDRLQDLELLQESFDKPEGFDIREYLKSEFKEGPLVRARVKFVPQAARIALANLTGWESVQENRDGSIEATLVAPDLYWLASLVLSFGAWVRVIDPPELLELVRTWAMETAAQYPSGN
jgi:predicted DNA-binding transcriptional regulator YafY